MLYNRNSFSLKLDLRNDFCFNLSGLCCLIITHYDIATITVHINELSITIISYTKNNKKIISVRTRKTNLLETIIFSDYFISKPHSLNLFSPDIFTSLAFTFGNSERNLFWFIHFPVFIIIPKQENVVDIPFIRHHSTKN